MSKSFIAICAAAIGYAAGVVFADPSKKAVDKVKDWGKDLINKTNEAVEEAAEKVDDLLDEGEAANGGNAEEQPKTE